MTPRFPIAIPDISLNRHPSISSAGSAKVLIGDEAKNSMAHEFSPVGYGRMERVIANILDVLRDEVDFHVLACADARVTSPALRDDVVGQECSSFGPLVSMPLSWEFVKVFKRTTGSFDIVHFNELFPFSSYPGASPRG
jgi:hypothetical protein